MTQPEGYRPLDFDPIGSYWEGYFRLALNAYRIEKRAFTYEPQLVLSHAANLLTNYQMDPAFGESREKCLFAIGVADQLLAEPDLRKHPGLYGVLKGMSVGFRLDNTYGTLSGTVDELAAMDDEEGIIFHPGRQAEVVWSKTKYEEEAYIKTFTNPDLTDEAQKQKNAWGNGTLLHTVRNRLGIERDKEKKLSVVVLDRTDEQIDKEMNTLALWDPNKRTIILPQNYQHPLPHEYVHSQDEDTLRSGYQKIFFSALSEGFTEAVTDDPEVYVDQRTVLKIIRKKNPETDDLLLKIYHGDDEAKRKFFSQLINHFGFAGFLAIARMDPDKYDTMNDLENKVYIPPANVIQQLTKRPGERSV